ncbi:MAG: CRISPR-associated endonuclease Cas2 [Patescibacteria group bacterium]
MKLEEQVRKRNKKADLQKMILATVKLAGMLAVTAVAPNVLGAMYKIGILPHPRQKESILNSRKRLVDKGFLVYKKGLLEITDSGRRFLLRETLFENHKNKKKKWDGKWRVLIFDIPEKRKHDREQVRRTLVSIGFMRLQKSVWVYPYDCEDLMTLLKADMKIGKDILYMIVEALEYDKPVRSYFGL